MPSAAGSGVGVGAAPGHEPEARPTAASDVSPRAVGVGTKRASVAAPCRMGMQFYKLMRGALLGTLEAPAMPT